MENLLSDGVEPIFDPKTENDLRDLAVEEYLLMVSDYLYAGLEHAGITKAELARRLGTTKGYVSQAIAARRNLTLRSIAEIAYALKLKPEFGLTSWSGEEVVPEHLKQDGWGEAKIVAWGGFIPAPPPSEDEHLYAAA